MKNYIVIHFRLVGNLTSMSWVGYLGVHNFCPIQVLMTVLAHKLKDIKSLFRIQSSWQPVNANIEENIWHIHLGFKNLFNCIERCFQNQYGKDVLMWVTFMSSYVRIANKFIILVRNMSNNTICCSNIDTNRNKNIYI